MIRPSNPTREGVAGVYTDNELLLVRSHMTVTIIHAQTHFPELIAKVLAGDEVVITQDEKPIARLVPEKSTVIMQPRVPGSAKDMISYMADDFDAPLEDFKEYME
jgi:antitoxin (DNA-binding transcriptional repressor) of toxin-antitoxin stability system